MNFRSFFLLLGAWLLVGSVQGQLFWKISGNGLTSNSYLFGTHHLIDKNLIPQFDSVLAICGQVDAVVGEMDMKSPGMQKKMMKGSVMKGKKIKDLVSPEDYKLLDTEFKSILGMGMNFLGSFKPMLLMSMHQLTLYLRLNDLKNQPTSVDELFQKKAREGKKKVIGLETIDFQINVLFDRIPLERQAEMLLYEVREKANLMKDLNQLNDVYVSGDLERMKALDVEDESMNPEERKMLVDDRNLNWIKQLPSLFEKQSCLVAVGCLHLVGETGLIHQLRLKGYTVEPMLFN